MSNYYRRLKMHFLNYRTRILIAVASVILVVLAVWGMMSLESYYRNITLATMPLQMLMVAMNAIIFVYMYLTVMRDGFSKKAAGRSVLEYACTGARQTSGMARSLPIPPSSRAGRSTLMRPPIGAWEKNASWRRGFMRRWDGKICARWLPRRTPGGTRKPS